MLANAHGPQVLVASAGRRPGARCMALVVASSLSAIPFGSRDGTSRTNMVGSFSLTPEHVAVYDGRASNVYNSPYSRFSILVIYFQYWVSQEWAETQW